MSLKKGRVSKLSSSGAPRQTEARFVVESEALALLQCLNLSVPSYLPVMQVEHHFCSLTVFSCFSCEKEVLENPILRLVVTCARKFRNRQQPITSL